MAKLSDTRERLHALVTAAARDPTPEHTWPRDLNAPAPASEETYHG